MTSSQIEQRLRQLSIELPSPAPPAGAYVAWVLTGPLLFVAGQLPVWDGEIRFHGRVDSEITVEDGYAAARLCGINLLAQVRDACGGRLDRVKTRSPARRFRRCRARLLPTIRRS